MPINMNDFVARFGKLLDMYLDIGVLNKEQIKFISPVVAETAGFYEAMPVSVIEEVKAGIKNIAKAFFENREKYIEDVKRLDSTIPVPKFKLLGFNLENVVNNRYLAPLYYTGWFSVNNGLVSPIFPFIMAPIVLERQFYSDAILNGMVPELTGVAYSDVMHLFPPKEKLHDNINFNDALQNVKEFANDLALDMIEYFKPQIGGIKGSEDVYELGAPLYRNRSEVSFTFSTTSGLIIPLEYKGGQRSHKNPLRRKYFDEGLLNPLASRMKRYYQWNLSTTARALFQDYQMAMDGELWKQEATNLLTKAFNVKNLEISEADFENSFVDNVNIGALKKTGTILTKNIGIVTNRDPERKKIYHAELRAGDMIFEDWISTILEFLPGVIEGSVDLDSWNTNFEAKNKDSHKKSLPSVLKQNLYDIDIRRIVKPMGEILPRKEAESHVRRLLELGKEILSNSQGKQDLIQKDSG